MLMVGRRVIQFSVTMSQGVAMRKGSLILCFVLGCGVDVVGPGIASDVGLPTTSDAGFQADSGEGTPAPGDAGNANADTGAADPSDAGTPPTPPDSGVEPERQDDHGNSVERGTAVESNSATTGVINYEEDLDYFIVRTAGAGTYRIATQGRTDTFCVLSLATPEDVALYSNDDSGEGENCQIREMLWADTLYAVAVRHFDPEATDGGYTLVIEGPSGAPEPICGNAIVEEGEECDDGNRRNGDGCDTNCRWEDEENSLPLGCQAVDRRVRRTALCWQPRQRAQAVEHCETVGMTLATIDNERDNEILFSAANNTSPWIGLSDQLEEGAWVWDSRTSGYSNWNRGEPNNWGGNEDCVEFTGGGRWNDASCDARRSFFCEDPR